MKEIGKTHQNKENNLRLSYPNKPIILGNLTEAIGSGKVKFVDGKDIQLYLPSGERVNVGENHQFNRVDQTLQELESVIHKESPLYEEFRDDISSKEKNPTSGSRLFSFGNAVYYPEMQDVVFYAPRKWHKIALILRNSLLIRDPKQEIDWKKQREIFDSLVVGVAGASVGKNAFMRIIDLIRPNEIKIADPKAYKDSNSNRVDLNYRDIGQNKAMVAARQVHGNDPFMNIYAYSEGLNNTNMEDFVGGNNFTNEPALNILVEETDDPIRKIESMVYAKKHKIPFAMVTDIGTAYQIDFRDFKSRPDLPLMCGIRDEEIIEVQRTWNENKRDSASVVSFGIRLLGDNWQSVPEFRDFFLGKYNGTTKEVPQLGAAASAGGSHLAVTIAKHALGARIPERFFFDLASRKIVEEGEIFNKR